MPESAATTPEAALLIRPTRKPAFIALALATAVVAVCYWAYFRFGAEWPAWAPLLSFLTFVPSVLAWLDTHRCSLSIAEGELRLKSGLLSKTTRSLDLRMVRAARAERALLQRLWNVGTLVVEAETAEARMEIRDIDAPARWAKHIQSAADAARSNRLTPRQTPS